MNNAMSLARGAGRLSAAALLALGLWMAAPAVSAEEQGPLDPRAVEKLQRMSDVLAKTRSLSLKAESLYDQVESSGVKIKRAVSQEVVLRRPDSLYFRSVRDDGKVREGRYDGKALTIVPERGGAYARIDVPGTVDTMLDLIQADYQVNVPIADLLYDGPYGRVKDHLLSGVYLGERTVGGEVLDQLSFETTGHDWQLWLERGDRPLPRRLVVTFVNAPGEPEYLTVIKDWKLDPALEGETFRFAPPPTGDGSRFPRFPRSAVREVPEGDQGTRTTSTIDGAAERTADEIAAQLRVAAQKQGWI
jgi:hypothetical protein